MGGGGGVDAVGASDSDFGTKFDRARIGFFVGDVLTSIAEADRAGGGPTVVPFGSPLPDLPGEAVCDLEGGGGAAGLGGSPPPAFLLTQRLSSAS